MKTLLVGMSSGIQRNYRPTWLLFPKIVSLFLINSVTLNTNSPLVLFYHIMSSYTRVSQKSVTKCFRPKKILFLNLVALKLLIFHPTCLKFFDPIQINIFVHFRKIGICESSHFFIGAKSISVELFLPVWK